MKDREAWCAVVRGVTESAIETEQQQMVKNLPAMQETWFLSLGWEDPLEKGMAPTPVFLPGEFHQQRSLVGYSSWGREEMDMTE